MSQKFRIDVNSGGPNSIETESKTLAVDGSFTLEIANQGAPTHIHLNVSDSVAPYVSLQGTNIYVEDEEVIGVTVGPVGETVEGYLEVTSGYGSRTERVTLVLEASEAGENPVGAVDVDESLAQPRQRRPASETELLRVDLIVAAILVFAVFMLLLYALLFGQFVLAFIVALLTMLGGSVVYFLKEYPERDGSKD